MEKQLIEIKGNTARPIQGPLPLREFCSLDFLATLGGLTASFSSKRRSENLEVPERKQIIFCIFKGFARLT